MADIYHACDDILAPLDLFQTKSLSEVGISNVDALFYFDVAPLRCRRGMAMLGVMHRCALRNGPEFLRAFFFKRYWKCKRETWKADRGYQQSQLFCH